MRVFNVYLLAKTFVLAVFITGIFSCGNHSSGEKNQSVPQNSADSPEVINTNEDVRAVVALMVSPETPSPGQVFRVMLTGGKNVRKANLEITGPTGGLETVGTRSGEGLPFWQIDEFKAGSEGKYHAAATVDGESINFDFSVSQKPIQHSSNSVWNSKRGWDSKTEALYSAWINALFQDSNESASWKALNETTENKEKSWGLKNA